MRRSEAPRRWFLTPRWIVAHLVVVTLAVVFVNLGFWQLGRLEERRLANAVGESRYGEGPVDIGLLLSASGQDVESLEYRRATANGEFQPEHEVLIRSQVYRDTAGFHVITPLLLSDDSAVLVDRGWVPLGMDEVPVSAAPPDGQVTILGWVRPSQERQGFGPADPAAGRLVAMNRVDIDRIQEQVPFPIAPVYLSMLGEQATGDPILAATPTFDDEGPHLAYAIQWFGFTLVGIVGYAMLMKRSAGRSG